MFIRTRKYLTFTTLISGLLLVLSAPTGTMGASSNNASDITIEPISEKAQPTAAPSNPAAKINTPIPVKTPAPVPTLTPAKTIAAPPPAKIAAAPTKTATPVKTNTPIPVKTQIPTSTPTQAPAAPTATPDVNSRHNHGSQISLSLDALGQFLYRPKTDGSYLGGGGQVFMDWRMIQYLSLGFGGQYSYFPGTPKFSLGTFDLSGRIFPLPIGTTPGGEIYLQGGLGLNLTRQKPENAKYHGYAGIGYRHFLSETMALDTGVQYDFYNPLSSPTHGIGAKVGITFLFGRTRWPLPADNNLDEDNDNGSDNGYNEGSRTYKWRAGDTLRTVSTKVYADPLYFSVLVDANHDLFLHPVEIRVDTEIKVPALNFSPEALEAYQDKALHTPFYINLDKISARFGYEQVQNWPGSTRYIWKKYDTLPIVAEKIYGDDDFYPILVDANDRHLIHPANLRPGVVLVVPPPPAGVWVDVVHKWAWSKDPYIWWKVSSQESADEKPKPKE